MSVRTGVGSIRRGLTLRPEAAEKLQRLSRRVGRVERRVERVEQDLSVELQRRVEALEGLLAERLRQVETGLREQAALSQRIAILGDFVAEVVSASARADSDALERALARYADGL
jgi:hypothetical protein